MDIRTSASFGISMYPQDGETSIELLKHSDMAIYHAKNSGKNSIHKFEQSLEKDILDRIKLENQLALALEKNEIHLVFQPQYKLSGKKLRGFEILVRWRSQELGLARPDKFIPIAEKNGFIILLGEWIIRQACEFLACIKKELNYSIIMSINISAVQIMESGFVEKVKKTIKETGVEASLLEFEITETVFISSMELAVKTLNELKELGIKIALDDFGTGYSSLNYLHMLPIDTLKIDKTFIDTIIYRNEKEQIVGPLVSLMHKMGLTVIAEGVEENKQLSYLMDSQCDIIQGYIWGKPITEEEVWQIIKNEIL